MMMNRKEEVSRIINKSLNEYGERRLIEEVISPYLDNGVNISNEDCSIIEIDGLKLLLTVDQGPSISYLQKLNIGSLSDVGHYYAEMSFSDIAAMGGKALGLLLSLGMPPGLKVDSLRQIMEGVSSSCESADAKLLGGDSISDERLDITTYAVGVASDRGLLRRSGARVGDLMCVSGPIGSVLASYLDVASAVKPDVELLRPKAQLKFAQKLNDRSLASSCIDMSDGFYSSAGQIADINNVKCIIDFDKIPLDKPQKKNLNVSKWYEFVLSSGGGYQLMFTCSSENVDEVESAGGHVCGELVEGGRDKGKVEIENLPLGVKPVGWEHFKSTEKISSSLMEFVDN